LKRNKAQEQIDFNPTEITFYRKEEVFNNTTGSLDTIESNYTETIRITKQNSTTIQVNQDLGVNFKKQGYVLLGNYESQMKCNKFVTDYFNYLGENYKLTNVMVNMEKNSITSVQAIAEVMEQWQI
jgi:hypothetical protein